MIEIPANINALRVENAAIADYWREATRKAFMSCINAGFLLTEFYRVTRHGGALGAYLLEKATKVRDLSRLLP